MGSSFTNLADRNLEVVERSTINQTNSEDAKMVDKPSNSMVHCSLHRMCSKEALEKLKSYYGYVQEILEDF